MTRRIDQYPSIEKAIVLMEVDNGGHLLAFYGAGPPLEEIVEAKMIAASAGCDETALARIETYLAGLTGEQLETLTQGEESDIDALHAPDEVEQFLTRVFEASIAAPGSAA